MAILTLPFTRSIQNKINDKINQAIDLDDVKEGSVFEVEEQTTDLVTTTKPANSCCSAIGKHLTDNMNVNIDNIVKNNERVTDIHEGAEKFDEKTEEYFKSLQIFTAICDSFSHG